MRRRWATMLAVVVAGCLSSAAAQANPWHGFGGPGMGRDGVQLLPFLVGNVGLTDAQRAQIRQIAASHRAQFQSLASQLRTAHGALNAKLYGAAPLGQADVAPLVQQINQLRGQMTQEGLQVALEVRAVLTPEQLAKAAQIHQRLDQLRAEMRSLLGGR